MKNPAPYIRTQVFALLSGSVLYETITVPVYEGGSETKQLYKIIIGDMTPANRWTKTSVDYVYDLVIEVIYEGPENIRKPIDEIAEQVMEKFRPGLYTQGIPDSADWQITGLNVNAPRYINDLSETGDYIKRALVNVNFLITQRQYA